MIVDTPIGEIRVFVAQNRVVEVLLPGWHSEIDPLNIQPESKFEKKIAQLFDAYFLASEPLQAAMAWKNLVEVVLPQKRVEGVSDFHARVYRALLCDVDPFNTVSYKELAELAGNPLAARATGTAMRKNPLPIVVPCHRVIAADGTLGGYMGASNEEGLVIKKWLLHHEGAL